MKQDKQTNQSSVHISSFQGNGAAAICVCLRDWPVCLAVRLHVPRMARKCEGRMGVHRGWPLQGVHSSAARLELVHKDFISWTQFPNFCRHRFQRGLTQQFSQSYVKLTCFFPICCAVPVSCSQGVDKGLSSGTWDSWVVSVGKPKWKLTA